MDLGILCTSHFLPFGKEVSLVVILCLQHHCMLSVLGQLTLFLCPAGPKELYLRSNKSGTACKETNLHQCLKSADSRGLSDIMRFAGGLGGCESISHVGGSWTIWGRGETRNQHSKGPPNCGISFSLTSSDSFFWKKLCDETHGKPCMLRK